MQLTRVSVPALSEADLFASLHQELSRWFSRRFTHFSPAQLHAVPEILAGRSVLLTSPTGSGKTLAAFLSVFDWLARVRESGAPSPGIVAVYVSPLRALAYDLRKNLQQPAEELGWDWLRIAARTGDTTATERAAQRRTPPHILVTTPESLTLMLSQSAWIDAFRSTRFLIADELHALAENKRGAMLMVAAERLEEIVATRAQVSAPAVLGSPLIRIGLSATVAPLETMAEFLVGPGRACRIAEIVQKRPARIEVFSPLRQHAYPPAGYTATRVLKELGALLEKHETALIFTNTRSGAESIGLRLKQLLPELSELIEVHHASLDRSVRLEIEDRLKRGELRAVVCSTSLEMGIDIGSIDLVVMVSAPKGVSRALQRIGRSGHSMGRISHGVLVASNINDLAECAVTARMMARRELEPVRIHENPLDVLAQTLVGLAVVGRPPAAAADATGSPTGDESEAAPALTRPTFTPYTADEAYALVRRSHSFHTLGRAVFDRVLRYLRGGGVSLERNYENLFGKVRLDDRGGLVVPSPRVARAFYQNVGTINTESMVQVRLNHRNLGQVEESFMKSLSIGDVFVLNGRTVRLVKTHLLTAQVARADHALPTVPRWYANKMPLASGLAAEVVRLRTELAKHLTRASPTDSTGATEAIALLESDYDLTRNNARALVEHFALQAQVSTIPVAGLFLIERYREGERLHLFFHALIGRSANDALSRIVAQRVRETKGGNALVTIDDYGFLLTLQSFQAMTDSELRALFVRDGAEEALRLALADASLVRWQFRGVAQTGLMVPRRVHGTERGTRMLQWSSEIIFDVLRQHEPDHPLLQEAYAEATLRFLDLPRALEFLESVSRLRWDVRDLPRVSPFSFGIFVSRIKETMTLEDPETTIERLYHAMYARSAAAAAPDPA